MLINALVFAGSMLSLFAAAPASTNFTLKDYDFGTGGATSSSSSYNLNGTVGSQTGDNSANGITILKSGLKQNQNANVPLAPTLSNPNGTYNKLHLVLNSSANPADTKFAIAISSDNFTTTQFVQADTSIGSVFNIANFQTYAQWGGATGFDILGLLPNTTYTVKVSAYQGAFTATGFGPVSAAVATSSPSISFSVATSANTTPPFSVNFVSLTANTVTSSTSNAQIGISTNALFGGNVYIKDSNSGLLSSSKNFTIASATADLSAAASGYGAQVTAISQTSGGPLTANSPYNGSANSVGGLSSVMQPVVGTAGPITSGSAQIIFMAKAASGTPAASDYTDTETLVAAMNF